MERPCSKCDIALLPSSQSSKSFFSAIPFDEDSSLMRFAIFGESYKIGVIILFTSLKISKNGDKIYSYRDIDKGHNARPSVCHHAWPYDQTSYIRLQPRVAIFTLPRDAAYVFAQVVRDRRAGFFGFTRCANHTAGHCRYGCDTPFLWTVGLLSLWQGTAAHLTI